MAKKGVSIQGTMDLGGDVRVAIEGRPALYYELYELICSLGSIRYDKEYNPTSDLAKFGYERKARELNDLVSRFKQLFRSESKDIFNEKGLTDILFDLHFNMSLRYWYSDFKEMLHVATSLELRGAKQMLLSIYDEEGNYLIHSACREGDMNMVQELISAKVWVDIGGGIEGRTPFYNALLNGHHKIARLLMEAGAATDVVNVADRQGNTLLHNANNNNNPDTVKLLLDAKANVDAVNKTGGTPLSYAAVRGDIEAAKLLLAAKANVNKSDYKDGTPLYWACNPVCAPQDNIGMVRLLLEAQANVHFKATPSSISPLEMASKSGINSDFFELLEEVASEQQPEIARDDVFMPRLGEVLENSCVIS